MKHANQPDRNRPERPRLDRRLVATALLIVLGEALHWVAGALSGGGSDFAELTAGLLLGLAVGMKVVGLVLLVVRILRGPAAPEQAAPASQEQPGKER